MKIKKANALKETLECAYTEVRLKGDCVSVRYDLWDEVLYVKDNEKEILLSVQEMKGLRAQLNRLLD